MDNQKIAKTLKYLKDCWYSEYYTDDEYSDEQYDDITEVVDYVISDILKIKDNEEIVNFKVGDIVRMIGSRTVLDDCEVAVVTFINDNMMYVMRGDGSTSEESPIDYYKVGCINWLPDTIRHIHDILEEY